jgi:hypothetical protein
MTVTEQAPSTRPYAPPRLLGVRWCLQFLVQVEHACGSCAMIPGRLAGRVTWSRGCGL